METSAATAGETCAHALRVLIVDDHDLFAQALQVILGSDERIEVVGHAANGAEAVEFDSDLRPDVVLMDISMPVMDGIEATRKIRAARQEACVLMLTGSNARGDVDRARAAGAAAYVTKDRIAADLVDAIIDAARGAEAADGDGTAVRYPSSP